MLPEELPNGMCSKELFVAYVGRIFPILRIDHGLLHLEVGEVVGELRWPQLTSS
jgi:hypothetical protein